MFLGAPTRRTSVRSLRRTALASAVFFAALAVTAGSARADDAAGSSTDTPYPPTTTPCAVSFEQAAQADPSESILIASGLGASQPVDATVYPQSTSIGSWVTDADGSLEAAVTLPATDDATPSWVTVSSDTATCSGPTPVGGVGPGDGPTTRPPSGVTTPPAEPTSGSTSTSSATTTPGIEESRGPGAPIDATSVGPTITTSNGRIVVNGSTQPGTGGASSSPGSSRSTTPTAQRSQSAADPLPTSSSAPPGAQVQAIQPGVSLPISIVVVIALLLLLGGGLAMLLLTRRSD